MKIISIIPYIGGKYHLVDSIVPIIEWCAMEYNLRGYLELCGGGARMLLNLPTTLFQWRLYNDINLGLANLFACLRNPFLTNGMIKKLLELGIDEKTFFQSKKLYSKENTNIATSAAYTYLVAHQSRAGNMQSFNNNALGKPHYYSRIYGLQSFSVILKGIFVCNNDAVQLLKENNHREDCFCYLDVPYVTESKLNKAATYDIEKERPFNHEEMVDILLSTKLKVALSGYSKHHIYDKLEESGFHKIFLGDKFVASSSKAGIYSEEFLWINFDIPSYLIPK